jgi:hypothetical protein
MNTEYYEEPIHDENTEYYEEPIHDEPCCWCGK